MTTDTLVAVVMVVRMVTNDGNGGEDDGRAGGKLRS